MKNKNIPNQGKQKCWFRKKTMWDSITRSLLILIALWISFLILCSIRKVNFIISRLDSTEIISEYLVACIPICTSSWNFCSKIVSEILKLQQQLINKFLQKDNSLISPSFINNIKSRLQHYLASKFTKNRCT